MVKKWVIVREDVREDERWRVGMMYDSGIGITNGTEKKFYGKRTWWHCNRTGTGIAKIIAKSSSLAYNNLNNQQDFVSR